jgi:hypothetical protein
MDGDVIISKLARALLGKRRFEVLLTLERHRFDDRGLTYWTREEWPDILREIERESGDDPGPVDERTPEFR